ncbi:MAG: S41 family peptidase [Chitinophagaceae bacterium]|nr:S41 family peptidase [Chitinophagaceae bacterium]
MKKSQAWLPLVFALLLILGMITGYKLRERVPFTQGFFQNSKRTSLQETIDLIRLNYVDPVSTDSLTDDAIEAMLSHLDPHSIFIPAKYLQEVNEDLAGNFEGIGVEFQIIQDTVHVVNVFPGGPSARAGMMIGDKFLKVGDSVVAGTGITSQRIKKLLRGPGATSVPITVLSGTTEKLVTVIRGTIPLYSVDASYMINDTTGFIHLNKFSGTSYEECMRAFENLKAKGMKKLIFDLRDNGGGILEEAVDIADEFLSDNKLIVYTQGLQEPKMEYRCKRPGQFENGQLVIIVDEGSASASEVIAGAIQDWDRGVIVGRRTFGKGLVQKQFGLSGGGALRLTVARYYTPTGRSIQKSYAKGRDAYNDEVIERFHNGEVSHADTIKLSQGVAFKTKGGRTVYAGGGITPDIFVPIDTTGFITDVTPLFEDQHFGKFIYQYYISNKPQFDEYKSAAEFSLRFNAGQKALNSLMEYVKANQIKLPALPEKDRAEMAKRIKTWMARQIWGMPGYYEVSNVYDLTVAKALEAK